MLGITLLQKMVTPLEFLRIVPAIRPDKIQVLKLEPKDSPDVFVVCSVYDVMFAISKIDYYKMTVCNRLLDNIISEDYGVVANPVIVVVPDFPSAPPA